LTEPHKTEQLRITEALRRLVNVNIFTKNQKHFNFIKKWTSNNKIHINHHRIFVIKEFSINFHQWTNKHRYSRRRNSIKWWKYSGKLQR